MRFHLAALTAQFLIAGSVIASKRLAPLDHPLSLSLLRFLLAAIFMLPLLLASRRTRSAIASDVVAIFRPKGGQVATRILKEKMIPGLAIGFFFAGYFLFLFRGLEATSALNAGSLGTLAPLGTALISLWFFGQAIRKAQVLAYALATLGTLVVVFDGQIARLLGFHLNPGDPWILAGVGLLSGYYIALKRFSGHSSAFSLAFSTVLGSCLWLALGLWLQGVPLRFTALLKPEPLFAMLYLAIFTTSGTTYLAQLASKGLTANQMSAYGYLMPIMTAQLAWALDGTPMSLGAWLGSLISLAACSVLLFRS